MRPGIVRRLAWVGVALCVVALALGVTVRALGPEPPGVTAANVRRIHLGMTLAEVEAVFGKSPDYCEDTEEVTCATWSGAEGDVDMTFDEDDRVDSVTFTPSRGPIPGPLDCLRSRLGWSPTAGGQPP